MRIRLLIVLAVIVCALTALAFRLAAPPNVPGQLDSVLTPEVYGSTTSTARADLDLDGVVETVAITCRRESGGHPLAGEVVVLQPTGGKLAVAARKGGLNPWKLLLVDVDGDHRQEIVLGVWKKSPKDPVMAKRVFVYNWEGGMFRPKWLGSRLSRRFEDFGFKDYDKDGRQELLALEVSPGRPNRVGIYRWKSFGFEWVGSDRPEKWRDLTK